MFYRLIAKVYRCIKRRMWFILQIPGRLWFYFQTNRFVRFSFLLCCLLIYCEFLHYYFVILFCTWPTLPKDLTDGTKHSSKPLKAMFIADTHILGWREGHWFDKLRRYYKKFFMANFFYTLYNVLLRLCM